MNRSTLTLIGTTAALAAVTGAVTLTGPGGGGADSAAAVARKPVERSSLVCPQPTTSDVAETTYTAFTPSGGKSAPEPEDGAEQGAALYPAELASADRDGGDAKDDKKDDKDGKKDGEESAKPKADPVLTSERPGVPETKTTERSDAPALVGSADGGLAPGWTVQQTTMVAAGAGRGLQGTSCSTPDTDFWFPGASTAKDRQDYVHLTNPDDTPAVVDLDLYGKDGRQRSSSGEAITVPPRSTVPVLLSTLSSEPSDDVTLHVVARAGRVGAQVQAVDEKLGGDWLRASADPAPEAVLPGIPADATSVRLVVLATGGQDADLTVRLSGPSGTISPAGHETLHVKGGMATAVDLPDLTKGEAGSLVLSPAGDSGDAAPVVAAARVTRGKGGKQETAFVPATAPVDTRATAAGTTQQGSTLALAAGKRAAKVRVTASATGKGGTPSSDTLTVKANTTVAFRPPRPKGGDGTYAVTVERVSGGPFHASRMLEQKKDGLPAFTVQTLPDDRGSVPVPRSAEDLSVLTRAD